MGNEIPQAPESCKSLLELAERCEAATGPDRELDCLIFGHLHYPKKPDRWKAIIVSDGDRPSSAEGSRWLVLTHSIGPHHQTREAPRYTASLDDTKALAKGKRVILNIAEDEITTAIVDGTQGVGNTAPLAFAAAALKSLAYIE